MKKTFLLAAVLFLCAIGAGAQTIKTTDGKKLDEVKKQIENTQTKLSEIEEERKKLLITYSSEYPKVKQLNAQIDVLKGVLAGLIQTRNELERKVLVKTLPNNNVELLKIIIEQNERIIELLEKLGRLNQN